MEIWRERVLAETADHDGQRSIVGHVIRAAWGLKSVYGETATAEKDGTIYATHARLGGEQTFPVCKVDMLWPTLRAVAQRANLSDGELGTLNRDVGRWIQFDRMQPEDLLFKEAMADVICVPSYDGRAQGTTIFDRRRTTGRHII